MNLANVVSHILSVFIITVTLTSSSPPPLAGMVRNLNGPNQQDDPPLYLTTASLELRLPLILIGLFYRRQGHQLRKIYVGASSALTRARLDHIAAQFRQGVED